MLKQLLISMLALCSSTLCLPAMAGGHQHGEHQHDHAHHHQTKSHGAHLHGVAELSIAIEGNSIEMALSSPAANIVGFEHRAESAEQIQALKQARSRLESPDKLFEFPNRQCAASQWDIDLSALEKSPHQHHGHSDDHHQHDTSHSEVSAHYRFKCRENKTPSEVLVHLIDYFPAIEKLKVQWITPTKQGAATLTARSKRIEF